MPVETILLYAAITLSALSIILPVAKAIARKTKTKTDDDVIEIIEEGLKAAKQVKADVEKERKK